MSITDLSLSRYGVYMLPTSTTDNQSKAEIEKFLKLDPDNSAVSIPVKEYPSVDLSELKPHEIIDMSDDPFYFEDDCDVPRYPDDARKQALSELLQLRALRTALLKEIDSPHPYTFFFFSNFRCPNNLCDVRFTNALSWNFQTNILQEKGITIIAANNVRGTPQYSCRSGQKTNRAGDVLLRVTRVHACMAFIIFKSEYQTVLRWIASNLDRLPKKPAFLLCHFWEEQLLQTDHKIYASSPFVSERGVLLAGVPERLSGHAENGLLFDSLNDVIHKTFNERLKNEDYHLVSVAIVSEPIHNYRWILRLLYRNITSHPRGPFQPFYIVAEKNEENRESSFKEEEALLEIGQFLKEESSSSQTLDEVACCGTDPDLRLFNSSPSVACFFFIPQSVHQKLFPSTE